MNILIADDEEMAYRHLSGLIDSLLGCHDIGHASDGVEAVYKAYDLDIDIVLVDVRMPRMSGIEAARHISDFEHPTPVVFTTAYEEHALDAFNVHAAGFLTKPVKTDALTEVLRRVQHQPKKISEPAVFDEIENEYICCRSRSGLDLIALNRIIYIQSVSKCTFIHHLRGRSITDQPLKTFEKRFGGRMMRVHRNALVNKAYVSGLKQGEDKTHMIVLRNSEDILEVSRRSLPRIREYLHTFMEPRMTVQRRGQLLAQYKRRRSGEDG